MEIDEISNLTPAETINLKDKEKDFPIIRCEDWNELLKINFDLTKKEITLICEKEQKVKILFLKISSKQLTNMKQLTVVNFVITKIIHKNIIYVKLVQIKFYVKIAFKFTTRKIMLLILKLILHVKNIIFHMKAIDHL